MRFSEETLLKLTTEIKNVYVEKADKLGGGNKKNYLEVVEILNSLKEEYDVSEINIISTSGIIFASTKPHYIGYDMKTVDSSDQSISQSNNFFSKFAREDYYVQEYIINNIEFLKNKGYILTEAEDEESAEEEGFVADKDENMDDADSNAVELTKTQQQSLKSILNKLRSVKNYTTYVKTLKNWRDQEKYFIELGLKDEDE